MAAKKKVLILLGSPRKKGNSALLAAEAAKGAKAAGATVETVYLQGLDIKACTACDACQRKPGKTGYQRFTHTTLAAHHGNNVFYFVHVLGFGINKVYFGLLYSV